MANELIINRTMAMCHPPARDASVPSADIQASFFKQMEEGSHVLKDLKVYAMVAKIAAEHGYVVEPYDHPVSEEFVESAIDIFRIPFDSPRLGGIRGAAQDHHVGLFESKKYRISKDGLSWILRARPSVTACALERPLGMAKLWWTFEGIPTNIIERPVKNEEARRFVAVTDMMAAKAMPLLNKAYAEGLKSTNRANDADFGTHKERVSIKFADNDGRPFAALVDAMGLDGLRFDEVAKGLVDGRPELAISRIAQQGASEVAVFLEQVLKAKPTPVPKLELNDEERGIKAVIGTMSGAGDDQTEILTAGVARTPGMSGLRGVLTRNHDPVERVEYIRAISGARPLSATLANRCAVTFENLKSPEFG